MDKYATANIKHLLNAIDELDESLYTLEPDIKEINLMITRTKRDIYAIIDTIINKNILYRE